MAHHDGEKIDPGALENLSDFKAGGVSFLPAQTPNAFDGTRILDEETQLEAE